MPYLIQEKNATNFSHHLGGSKDGVSMEITNATNAEMSNAQSETSQPDLKENLLNVKVNRGFFYLSNDFQVFYNTLNQKMIKETKTYDPSLENGGSLWSSLGGVLSLFLGVSFAMLFEVGFISWFPLPCSLRFKLYIRLQRSWPDMEERRIK